MWKLGLKPSRWNWMHFHQSFWKCSIITPESRHQKTTSNLLRINLNVTLRFSNEQPLEGVMYINIWSNSRGHPKNFVLCKFLKILMVSDETICKAFRIRKTLETKPIRENINFHYLPKLYIGFNIIITLYIYTHKKTMSIASKTPIV